MTVRNTIPVHKSGDEPEKLLTLRDAKALAADRVKIENYPHVIWWVMDKGYVVLPEKIRPKWFFATEEERVLPLSDD